MLNKIEKLRKGINSDEMIKSGIILFIMINLFNFLNYIFHFSMARLLGPVDYGTLAVLFSLIYLFNIPSEAVQNIVTKYTNKFVLKKEYEKIKSFLIKSLKRAVLISFLSFIAFIPVAFFLSSFLKIDFWLFIYTGILIFFIFSVPILRGLIQGRKKFFLLGTNMVFEGMIKVVLGILLVFLGFRVYGALTSVIMASLFAFFMIFLTSRDIFKAETKKYNFNGIYSYSFPYFVSIFSIVLIYSLDIVIAKRFFSPEMAGNYAVISMLGKMIFFGTFAISKAMFPLSSESYENNRDTFFLLKKSLIIVGLISSFVLIFYLFSPEFAIKILFGSKYTALSNILFFLGLSFTFLSLTNLLILYGLSINKIKKSSFFLLGFVFLEVVLLSIFNSSLQEFAIAFLAVNFSMLVFSFF